MATVNLRPNSLINNNGGWAITGGTADVVLADNVEGTFADPPDTDPGYANGLRVGFGTFALPSLAQVRTVQARLRHFTNASAGPTMSLRVIDAGGSISYEDAIHPGGGVTFTTTLLARATSPNGDAWTQADIDAIAVELYTWANSTFVDLRAIEVYLDVVYNQAPVATVTVPAEAAVITNDSTPDVSWTYSDPENDAQERYQVKIFNTAQFTFPAFSPDVQVPFWDSGEVLSAAMTATIGRVLPNDTYRAYVKVADVASSGRYSNWDFNTFSLNVVPPPVPVLTATVDNTLKRVTLTATSTGTPAVEFFDFDYSDDAGVTWFPVRGGTRVTAAASAATVIDYESPPNVARQYRARAGRLV